MERGVRRLRQTCETRSITREHPFTHTHSTTNPPFQTTSQPTGHPDNHQAHQPTHIGPELPAAGARRSLRGIGSRPPPTFALSCLLPCHASPRPNRTCQRPTAQPLKTNQPANHQGRQASNHPTTWTNRQRAIHVDCKVAADGARL